MSIIFKMLKMALLDCAINEKCCSVDGGRGICSHFSSPLIIYKWSESDFITYYQKHVRVYRMSCKFFFLLYNFREMWFLFCRVIVSSVELALYVFVYDNFHLVTLPWDSPWTWYICLFGVDFCYYWFHRAAHGRFINMLLKTQIIFYYSNLFSSAITITIFSIFIGALIALIIFH